MRALLFLALAAACKDEPIDGDADGFPTEYDCDDEDADTYPGAPELCDGVDNDCDGLPDEDGVDGPGYYLDGDGDGYGSVVFTSTACTAPAGYVENNEDCDDGDRRSLPGGVEVCDAADNDCDGQVDEEPTDAPTWYGDLDGDGYGKHTSGEVVSCEAPSGYVDNNGDCNDGDATLNPDALWYADVDGDGYGGELSLASCLEPDGFTALGGDCDDLDGEVSPGAPELCDGVDNDCDGATDDDDDDVADLLTLYPDGDGDGYGTDSDPITACQGRSGYAVEGGDCDDSSVDVNPGEAEVCYDAADNDCDLGVDEGCPDATVDDGDVLFSGASSYDYLGFDLEFGDFNGDAAADILMTAYGDDTVASGAGRVYIFAGPFTSGSVDTTSATASLYGGALSDYFGYTAAAIPDLDGDGDDEALIAAYSNNTAATDAGAVYLFEGPLSGSVSTTSAVLTVLGQASSDNLGYYLVTGGEDLSGDGVGDLVLGAHNADASTSVSSSGALYVISGAASGTVSVTTALATLSGGSSQDYVGYAAEAGQDLDGDGAADLAAGVAGQDQVVVLLGPLSGSYALADADATLSGATSGDNTGTQLRGGDLDGDGHGDLLIGAKYDRTGGTYAGAWLMVPGPITADLSLSSAAVFKVSEEGSSLYFGAQYQGAAVGDLDGDGVDDAFFGSYSNDFMATSAGAVFGFYGPLSGTAGVSDAAIFLGGASSNDYVGSAIAAGDADGDGLDDLLISARGRSTSAGLGALFWGSGL